MGGETMSPSALGIVADKMLDSYGFRPKDEGGLPISDSARNVLRRRMLPIALALIGHPINPNAPQAPQTLIAAAIDLEAHDLQQSGLSVGLGKYKEPGAIIDWEKEVEEITDPENVHPLTELADHMTKQLSPGVRAALTLASL